MNVEGSVGLSYYRVLDAIKRGLRDRILFVKYDDLCQEPQKTLRGIYNHIEEDYFEHNFNAVEHVITHHNDVAHGYVGLHQIRSRVGFVPNDSAATLGGDLFAAYSTFNLDRHICDI